MLGKIKKGKCRICSETRLLSSTNVCIFCSNEVSHGHTIKEFKPSFRNTTEVKCKSGKKDENKWMSV